MRLHRSIDTNLKAKVVVLQGMGGCGKTQLALEFCQQAQVEQLFTAILWINAFSPKTVAQSFTDIAKKISRVGIDQEKPEANVEIVKGIINARKKPWLMVFDNFDEPKAFSQNPLKYYLPSGNKGLIFLTSRIVESDLLGCPINISDMVEAKALELLFRSSKHEKSEENIGEGKKIIKRLGHLALAIDQAGAYIKGCIHFDAFLDHFHHRREVILRKIPDIWDYRRKQTTPRPKDH